MFKGLTQILHKFFQKTDKEGTFPNSIYEASTTLIPKPDKDIIRKKVYGNISYEQRHKIP